MADINVALAGVHAFAAQAATELEAAKQVVAAKTAELADAAAKVAEAEAQHLKGLGLIGAATVGSTAAGAVAKVEQGAKVGWQFVVSHIGVLGVGGLAGYGLKLLGWL